MSMPITNELVGMRKYDKYDTGCYTIIGNDGKNAIIQNVEMTESEVEKYINQSNIQNPVILLGCLKSYHIYYK